jgi:hypothetical protein
LPPSNFAPSSKTPGEPSGIRLMPKARSTAPYQAHRGFAGARGSASTRAQQFGVHPLALLPCPDFEKIDRDMLSDREVHAFQQSSHTIGDPHHGVNHVCQVILRKYLQNNNMRDKTGSLTPPRTRTRRENFARSSAGSRAFARPDQARQSVKPIQKQSRSGFAPGRARRIAGG